MVKDKPTDYKESTIQVTFVDPCNVPIVVDPILPQTVYVNGPRVTFYIKTSTVIPTPPECENVVYTFSDASSYPWMSVDPATGEVTMVVTDSSQRGTYTDQKVQISLPSYQHNLGEASLTVNVLTCEDLTLTLPTVSPFTP